ncbi:MAG: DnaA ATPase domain-containing protein [Hyphomonas sp.]
MDRNQLTDSGHLSSSSSGGGDETRPGKDIWADVLARLEATLNSVEFLRWISGLRLIAEVDGEILIAARDQLSYDRVTIEHRRQIQRFWRDADPARRTVRIVCWRTASAELRDLVDDPWAKDAAATQKLSDDEAVKADVEDKSARKKNDNNNGAPEKTFETLVQGESNKRPVQMALRIARGQPVGTSSVLIYGLQGVGKTHILQALIAEAELNDPERKVIYMTAEEFLSAYTDGVKARDTSALKKRLRAADVLLIDDLHRIAGKKGTETELYQNIREVTSQGGIVVMAGDQAPGDVTGFSPRMRGELTGSIAVEVAAPCAEMRQRIITDLAEHIHQSHPNFVLDDLMVARINSAIRGPGRELTGAVWSLFTEAGFGEEAPTMEMLERIIRRVEGTVREPSIELVKRAAMKVFSVTKADLESPCKARAVVYPRQIAMYLCREETGKSLPQIGRSFGKRDHTTVLYSHRKLTKAVPTDTELCADIAKVRAMIFELQAAGSN